MHMKRNEWNKNTRRQKIKSWVCMQTFLHRASFRTKNFSVLVFFQCLLLCFDFAFQKNYFSSTSLLKPKAEHETEIELFLLLNNGILRRTDGCKTASATLRSESHRTSLYSMNRTTMNLRRDYIFGSVWNICSQKSGAI